MMFQDVTVNIEDCGTLRVGSISIEKNEEVVESIKDLRLT
jgi:hypothetical protein